MRLGLIAFCIGFSLASTSSLASLNISEQLGTRSRAMGGAGRGVATTNEAMYLNPAGMSQFRRFNLDADYVGSVAAPLQFGGLSLVDSTTGAFAGGIDLHLGFDPAKSNSLSYLASGALSYAAVENTVFIGGTVKYAFLPKNNVENVQVNQLTFDAGILVRLPFGLSVGAAGYNLGPTNSKRLPMSAGVGLGFNLGGDLNQEKDLGSALAGLTIAADWLMRDLTKAGGFENQISAGLEYLLLDLVPLRGGYSYSMADKEHTVSGGLGIILKDFGLDGFYEQNVTDLSKRNFGVAVRLFF